MLLGRLFLILLFGFAGTVPLSLGADMPNAWQELPLRRQVEAFTKDLTEMTPGEVLDYSE